MAKVRGERREFWPQHIRAWRQSGLRREAYCREHDLNPQTFNVWAGRLREEFQPIGSRSNGADTAPFVSVEVASESEAASATGMLAPPIEIEAGSVTLRVAQDADTDVLTRNITAVRRSALSSRPPTSASCWWATGSTAATQV